MDHPVTTARIVEPGKFEGRGVTAVLDRGAIEETLRSGEGDELLLDVARRSNGDVEAHIVRVDLGREDLERILEQAEGDRVALEFDQGELEDVLGADVEAHGLRDKALVLTVAAATAVGAAGGASAAIPHSGSGGSAGAGDAPYGAVAASAGEAPAAVIGGAGSGAASEAPYGAVAASAGEAPATVIGGAGEPAETSRPASEPTAQPSTAPEGGGTDPAVIAGVAGGLGALAITAAAFARRRPQAPRPA
jgi:hypothetical protein